MLEQTLRVAGYVSADPAVPPASPPRVAEAEVAFLAWARVSYITGSSHESGHRFRQRELGQTVQESKHERESGDLGLGLAKLPRLSLVNVAQIVAGRLTSWT